MKILHILDHSLPLQDGYSFRSQNILHAQRKRGWQPVALTSPKHEEGLKGPGEMEEDINGILYHRTGAVSNNELTFDKEIRLMISLGRRIQELIRREKPDILHAHSPVLNAIPALWAGRKFSLPVVYEIRAFWEDAAVDHGNYREGSWKYKMVRSIETWACRRADQVAVLCQGIKDDLIARRIPAEKMTIIYNAINPEDFKPCPPDEEFIRNHNLSGKRVIGFVGSFYRYEGLDLLINAFSQISKAVPESVLLLVGGGEMEDELREQIQRLRLNDKVIMPGRIPHNRIAGIYALIDILAYPRYSMRLTDLVTPLKPLEAMAMGKALLASDVGGHRELIRNRETGVLFSAGQLSSLAQSIEKVLLDNELRKTIEKKSYRWVRENHTWDKTTSPYNKIYTKAPERNKESHKMNLISTH